MNQRKYIDKIIVNLKNGYTLVELLIVIAIMVVIALFGVPAISKYNRMSEFRQKTEEVKGLFGQTYAMALNPTNTGTVSYRIVFDTSTADHNTYSLVSCTTTDCNTMIEKVDLSSERTIGFTASGGTSWLIECSTKLVDGNISCRDNASITGLPGLTDANLIDDTTPIFSDNNSNVLKSAKFTIPKSTFNINVSS